MDFNKNVTEVFDAQGTVAAAYDYSPYGTVTGTGNLVQPVQWSSEMNDGKLALVYYNYRYYNPVDGRWINRDPIAEEGGRNLYRFVGNSTISEFDILGSVATSVTTPQGVLILLELGYSTQKLLKMGIPLALINEGIKLHKKKIKCKDLDNKVKQAKENKQRKINI